MNKNTEFEKEKLRAIQAVFEESVKNNTIENMEAYTDENFSFVSFTDKSFDNFQSFKQQWKVTRTQMIGNGAFETQLNPNPSLVLGDIAICHGNANNSMVDKKGKPYEFSTHWTVVLKCNEGEWKVLRAHNSLDPFANPMLKNGIKKALLWTGLLAFVGGSAIGAAVMAIV